MKIPSIVVSIDIEKAFNSIEIPFLQAILTHMNCGHHFLTIIKPLYAAPEAGLCINKLQGPILTLQ